MGMIAAASDNNLGLAGVNNHGVPDIRFCPIKISGNWGEIWMENAAAGLDHATGKLHRSDVINCSWGGSDYSNLLEEKMQGCFDIGIPVLCAAGHSANGISFPAWLPTVAAVASTNNYDLHDWSSPLSDSLDFSAPGYGVWSWDLSGPNGINLAPDTCNWDYNYFCDYRGTSFATPLAAGVAAKVLLRRPDLVQDTTSERILMFFVFRRSIKYPGGLMMCMVGEDSMPIGRCWQ